MNPWRLRESVRRLRHGGIIACATEAVYGLSCNPGDAGAVARLLKLKQRPESKGLILVGATLEQLIPWLAPLSVAQHQQLCASWPGPVTWVVDAATTTPAWLTGGRQSLAVRVTAHPQLAALCLRFGGALVSTSANLSDHRPARNPLAVRRQFGDNLDYILSGPGSGLTRPTTIHDLRSGERLR